MSCLRKISEGQEVSIPAFGEVLEIQTEVYELISNARFSTMFDVFSSNSICFSEEQVNRWIENNPGWLAPDGNCTFFFVSSETEGVYVINVHYVGKVVEVVPHPVWAKEDNLPPHIDRVWFAQYHHRVVVRK